MSIEKGTVKWFNPAADKRYGFVQTDSGEEIFFHFGDGRVISVDNSAEPEWDSLVQRLRRDPKRGDMIVFSRMSGRKGPKACPWGFAEEYDAAMVEIESRKEQYPVGLYFRGRPGYMEYFIVFESGMQPHDWNVLVPDASLFSIWPIVQGRDLVIEEFKRRIESDRTKLRDYDHFLANPPRLELDANGDGFVHYREFHMEVKGGKITKGNSSSFPAWPAEGSFVWFDQMGGIKMDDLKDDAATMIMLQQNAVDPGTSFHQTNESRNPVTGYDAVVNRVREERTTALWRLVNSHIVYAFLTEPAVKGALEEVRDRATEAVVKAGKVVGRKFISPHEEFVVADQGQFTMRLFDIPFNTIGEDVEHGRSNTLLELQIRVRRVGYAPWNKKIWGKTWAEVAEPFRREIAELCGFVDYFEAWLEIYGR